ncbi:ISL3 family transposase [Desulfuromonas sp. CSMB_57]|uniref:ISL3 family transposase n=1 Tax=Desulfuromonas sp. CSMB_57 TaxID=2807629 RepID=UPI001CD3A690|nr:ISL3 family transposase [Desulfuromonas sp. CSMB_57]
MLLKSILNRVQLHRGFVYGAVRWSESRGRRVLEIEIRARKGSRPTCSGCGRRASGYDVLSKRRFEFVPLWGIAVFFLYAMRRVACPRCGVKVERVPWAEGKNHLTTTYAWFLARWAKRLSWKEVGAVFQTSWDNVFRSVKMAVAWGLSHRNLENVTAIGIDEIAWKRGHKYLTLVYQIDAGCRRLLWVGQERTQKTLRQFFKDFGQERTARLTFICSDMWKPYLRIVAEVAGQALHVLDRFHIMTHVSKAIDQVRAKEAKELKAHGQQPVLTGSRWCLLKRPENLSETQTVKLKELLKLNLKTVRAYLLKEDLGRFWHYKTPGWAGRFLDDWCKRTMRSRLTPMKKVARMLRSHRGLLLNWFRAKGRVALGAVEGLNNKAKVTSRKAYGYRSFDVLKVALYHTLGDLPEPKVTHRFC